ncbi:hypothetical protein BRD01_04305 [Halobacteriales archaeon QS_8_65_32]|nr:MAG: hypothetical protein BRD01_04305 [Halobacteriales archaeon QS_8_65_32]
MDRSSRLARVDRIGSDRVHSSRNTVRPRITNRKREEPRSLNTDEMGVADPFDDPPERIYGIRKRTLLRVAIALVTVLVVAIWFRVPLAGVWAILWPPDEVSGRWFTLVMTVALSFLIPVAVVLRFADIVYDRYLADEDS